MPKTVTGPSPVDPAVLCNSIPLQGHRQASAIGSLLGASAEGSVSAEQDRWGKVGHTVRAVSGLHTSQLCLLHSALLPGGSLRSPQQGCNDAVIMPWLVLPAGQGVPPLLLRSPRCVTAG